MEEENSNNNQENQPNWGGAREGAGRPKGSGHKPKIVDDLTEDQKKELLSKVYKQAIDGDSRLLQFLLEQIYGKANQAVDFQGQGNFILEIAKQVADKNEQCDITQNARNSSGGQS